MRTGDERVHVLERGPRAGYELEERAQREGRPERKGEEHGARGDAGHLREGLDHASLPLRHAGVRVEVTHGARPVGRAPRGVVLPAALG